MAERDQDPNEDLDTQGIPDLDAAPGPAGRARGTELSEDEDLDSEGQPDLMGALPGKEITGDAQEGEVPPPRFSPSALSSAARTSVSLSSAAWSWPVRASVSASSTALACGEVAR